MVFSLMGFPGDFLPSRGIRDRMKEMLDEALIERYVRFRSTLSPYDMERARSLVQSSKAARHLADFFREYYDTLDEVTNHMEGSWDSAQEGET